MDMQANTLRITPTGLALDPIKTPVLYRAFSDLSATTFSFDSGFQASLREWPARVAPSQFTTYLKRHLDWRNRLPSPFISLRSSWDETVAFAEAMLTNQYFSHKNVRIAYIDVQKLIDCGVEIPGDVEKIIERLDHIIYTEWCRYSDGRDLREFITTDHICVGHIPLECIILVEELAYSPEEGRLILRPVTRDGKSAMYPPDIGASYRLDIGQPAKTARTPKRSSWGCLGATCTIACAVIAILLGFAWGSG